LIAVAVAMPVSACGDSGDDPELSRSTARSLRADLNEISRSVRAGDCTTAQQVTAQLQSEVDGLPNRVSAKLRRALSDSAARLETLVQDQCEPAAAPEPVVTPEPTQDTSQDQQNKEEKQDKSNKDKKDKQKEKPKEVPPGQDGGNGTTPPGQQDGDQTPGGDTGGASPEGE
jgi:hypothetical protein